VSGLFSARLTRSALPVIVLLVAVACARGSVVEDMAVRVDGNLVLVPTHVNESSPLTFILDTGASSVVLDNRRAAELGLDTVASDDAQTGGGAVKAGEAEDVTIRVGRAELAGITVATIDLRPLDGALGMRIDGILGYEIFAKYVIEIDYAAQHVRLHDPSRYRDAGRNAVPMTLEERLPVIRVDLARAAGGTAEAKVELDTGLTAGLMLTRTFVESNRIVDPVQPRLRITTGALLPGKVSAEVVRLPAVRVGSFHLERIVTNITPTSEEAGVSGNTVGLLGAELLRRFTVVIDYPHSRLLLEPNAALLEPDEFDMTGMSLAALVPQTYSVRLVLEGSPAAEAGVQAGDVLVAIDGRPASQMALSTIRALFQQEGNTYTLQMKRGDTAREIRLTTRRLV
jgi:predicted aspartyl protease